MNTSKLMDRRFGVRVPTDCRLTAFRGGRALACRAADLSAGGALIRRRRRDRSRPLVQRFELHLGGGDPVSTLARTVWSRGPWQAVRFVGLSDVDRLEIAEHLDAVEGARRCLLR